MQTKDAAVILAALAAAGVAQAADPPSTNLLKYGDPSKASLYQYDTSVPAAPALALVENAPELAVTSPFGPDVASDAVLTSEHPGASFAARPYWALGFGRKKTLASYRDKMNPVVRVFARSTFSAAAAAREFEGSDGLGAGLGLHTEILNNADPRYNTAHLQCIGHASADFLALRDTVEEKQDTDATVLRDAKAYALTLVSDPSGKIAKATSVGTISGEVFLAGGITAKDTFDGWRSAAVEGALADEAGAPLKTALANCFKRGALAAENSLSFQIGAGTSWAAKTYSVSKLASEGAAAWGAFRVPLGKFPACKDPKAPIVSYDAGDASQTPKCLSPFGNITAFGHFVSDDAVNVGGKDLTAATSQAGLVFSHKGRNDKWAVAASAVWNSRNYEMAGMKTDKFERYALTASAKIFSGVWFEATFGETSGLSTAKEESFGLVRLTWK